MGTLSNVILCYNKLLSAASTNQHFLLPRIDPESSGLVQTDRLVGNDFMIEPGAVLLAHTLLGWANITIRVVKIKAEFKYLEFPHEGVDTDDGEDEPEDDADCQHIEDTRKSSN